VALSLGSPPPDVIRHRISMEPGLSSPPADTLALAERPSGLLTGTNKGVQWVSVKLLVLGSTVTGDESCKLLAKFADGGGAKRGLD
jgi:hypothetical protein